jgi:transcription antitermination protein NusB
VATPGAVGARRRARERALGLLYEAEVKGTAPAEVLLELPVAPESYATTLVEGVGRRQGELDVLIAEHAHGWALDRLATLDRQLLRLSAYELVEREEIPVAVVIDEAVELAKQYCSEESGRFVNGVLSAIATEVRANPVKS